VDRISLDVPQAAEWLVQPGIRVSNVGGGAVDVAGDDSAYGFQIASPLIKLPRDADVEIEINLKEQEGNVALGVMDSRKRYWLAGAAPVNKKRKLTFNTGDNGSGYIIVANLNNDVQEKPENSVFSISSVQMSFVPRPMDRLEAWLDCYTLPPADKVNPSSTCQSEAAARELLMHPPRH
jgi:hypothetical protein